MMLLEVPDLGNVKIGAACGIAPTLRTEREEWGTHFVGCVRVIERPGHPPPAMDGDVWTTDDLNFWREYAAHRTSPLVLLATAYPSGNLFDCPVGLRRAELTVSRDTLEPGDHS